MRPDRTRLRAALGLSLCLLVVVAAGCGKDREPAEISSFTFDRLRTSSDEMAVDVEQVSGKPHDGYMEWACLLSCRESDGCHADLRVTLFYQSDGQDEQIVLTGTMDVPVGARARFSRVQRTPMPVDRVERAEVVVIADRGSSDAPPPTPRI